MKVNLTKKQQKWLLRIILGAAGFIILEILIHAGAFDGNRWWIGLLVSLVPYLIVGWDVIRKSIRNISHGEVFDENFLMMIATFGAFAIGEYPEAVAVMLLYQIGELFQNYATGRSRDSISQLMSLAPETALVERNGETEEVDPDEVEVGEIIVVRPGEKIPLDGEVIEGESLLDTVALTGESVPRSARVGDQVISGCVNGKGLLKIRTTKCYDDSTVAKILELVENATDKKTRVENFVTRFAHVYTPVVTICALILAIIPPLILGGGGDVWISWIRRACIFLVVSCPCALVISVPLGFFGGIGAASRIGVLVKGSNYLEAFSNVKTIVFDKTGTLTKGEFRVTSIRPAGSVQSPEQLLEMTAYAESYSTHPVADAIRDAYELSVRDTNSADAVDASAVGLSDSANDSGTAQASASRQSMPDSAIASKAREADSAIVSKAREADSAIVSKTREADSAIASKAHESVSASDSGQSIPDSASASSINTARIEKNEEIAGHGVLAIVDGRQILAGNEKLMRKYGIEISETAGEGGAGRGGTIVYVACDGAFAGEIVISDSIKEGVLEALRSLKESGVRQTVMLTGDNKAVAEEIAREAGVDQVYAQLLPADKVERVEKLINEQSGKDTLAFVGDGINDAPVLMRADVGIAMGVIGSDAAIEAADIVLMDDDVRKISKTVRIARKTMGIIHTNICFAIAVKILILILSVFGIANMWVAIFGDVGVLILCILNAMRMLRKQE